MAVGAAFSSAKHGAEHTAEYAAKRAAEHTTELSAEQPANSKSVFGAKCASFNATVAPTRGSALWPAEHAAELAAISTTVSAAVVFAERSAFCVADQAAEHATNRNPDDTTFDLPFHAAVRSALCSANHQADLCPVHLSVVLFGPEHHQLSGAARSEQSQDPGLGTRQP